MVGLGKMVLANNTAASEFGCFITPSQFTTMTSNGAYTTPFFNANVTGGVGPFTYQWAVDSNNFTIESPTAERTRLTTSGYNIERFTQLSLVVTDTNNSATTLASITVTVFFGTQS